MFEEGDEPPPEEEEEELVFKMKQLAAKNGLILLRTPPLRKCF